MDCHNFVSYVLICSLCFQFSSGQAEQAVRLRGGRTALDGQVEVYLRGSWGVIQDDHWTVQDATVVCRQMGFAAAVDALQTGYSGVWPPVARVVLDDVECTGKESSLLACKLNNVSRLLADTETISSVVCAVEGSIQLVGGCCPGEGILQTLVNGAWLPMCADGWSRAESQVACRQLGFEQGAMFQAIPYDNVTFAPKSYSCNGSEYNMQSCASTQQPDQCGSTKAISLQCKTDLNSLRPLCKSATTTLPNCQPVAPQTLGVSGSSCSSLTLVWSYLRGTRQSAAQYQYTVRYRPLGNSSWEYAGASTAGQAAGTGRFSVGGLEASTWYEVQVSAKNGLGSSSYSAAIIAQTQVAVVSAAPLNVSLVSVGYSSVQISWTEVQTCNGTVGYEVVLSPSNATSIPDHIERFLPDVRTGDQISYTLHGLMSSMSYMASVRAFVYSDLRKVVMTMSPASEPLLFATIPIPAPVDVVIQPLAPPQGHTHKVLLQANWTSPSDVSGYTLQCSAEGVGPLTLQAQVVAPGNTVSALLLANPNTLYNCSIAAVCGSGDCSLKTYVLVQTPEIAGDGPNDTGAQRVPAAPPTLLKATLLSSSADTQTFNFTWEVAPEAASNDHLRGFVLRCHDSALSLDSSSVGGASVSGVTFVQSGTPLYSLAIAVATSCRELACQVSAFNEVGEGVASSVVTLPPSCSEDQPSQSFLSNPSISLAFLASLIVLAIVLVVLVPVICVCVLSRRGKRKRVYGKSIENGALPADDNYTTMAPSPCPNSMWREHTMSLKSQKMATLSVNAMEMARHPYDTIDKASVQNFYDEIRPKVLPATSTEQLSRVPIVGAKVPLGGVPQSSPRAATRHNRGSTEYVEMFSIITPDTPHTSIITPDTPHTSPSKQTASVLLEPIAVQSSSYGNIPAPSEHVGGEDVTMTTSSSLPAEAPRSPPCPLRSCEEAAKLYCAVTKEGNTPVEQQP